MKKSLFAFMMLVALSLALAACGGGDNATDENNDNGAGGDAASGSIGEATDYKIVGIEPGAGVMKAAQNAIDEYGLDNWTLVESSSAAMGAELTKAYENEEPIIVTGWTPHWKFAKFDLKYLEDPKGVFGEEESIHTLVRKGLQDDQPSAYTVLDQFEWTSDDMAEVMVAITEGASPEEAAAKWIEENSDKVEPWTEGADKVDGEKISLAYVAWDSEIASTNVVAKVLESIGYEVETVQLDAAPMFAAVAQGDVDGMVAAWLPFTHADNYEEYGDQVEDLGENLKGAKIGLVVPTYVDIDSIEDLKSE